MFAWWVNGLGIVTSAVGTVLLFVGSPQVRFALGDLMEGTEDDPDVRNQQKAKRALRKRRILRAGLFFLMAGFILQFIAWIAGIPGVVKLVSSARPWLNTIGMLIALGGTIFVLLKSPKGDPPHVTLPGEHTINEWKARDRQYKAASYGNVAIVVGLCIQFLSSVM